MGEVAGVSARMLTLAMRLTGQLLDAREREAVLGDLAEAGQGGWSALAAVGGLASRRVIQRLRRGEALLPAYVGAAAAEPLGVETWQEWVLPLAAGLIGATAVVALLVPPRTHTLSWPDVVSHSAFLLCVAAVAAIAAVLLLHRTYREYFRRPGAALLACAWSAAIWIPLLLLVWSEHAIWAVLAPAPVAGLVASFAKRKQGDAEALGDYEALPAREAMFVSGTKLGELRIGRLAVAVALLAQMLAIAVAYREVPLVCSLVIVTTACLAWGFTPGKTRPGRSSAAPVRARVAVLPCFLLTCLALTPFVQMGLGSGRLMAAVLANPLKSAPQLKPIRTQVYSGVVLMAPPLPTRKLLTSPPRSVLGEAVHLARPLVIPFDGAYWYFQAPAAGPVKGAKVQRGDPTKAHIHSSDWTPIEMEAHQRLNQRLNSECCRSLSVALVNGDIRIGAIEVEARLRNLTGKQSETVSLGTIPLRSSLARKISTARPNVEETLRFPIEGKAASVPFNEITLIFKLASERNLAGARVRVSSFTLQP